MKLATRLIPRCFMSSRKETSTSHQIPHDNKIYRVSIDNGSKCVKITPIGINGIDNQAEGWYDSVDVLPRWVQEKMALLMMSDAQPPIYEVDDVGKRINNDIFWIYHP